MIRDNYINIDNIITDSKVLKLFRAVEKHGGVIRFVGGCVRDTIGCIKGFDLDLATDLSPEELVEACQENGIKTVPIGIKFGTIGVVLGDNVLEVTSLRKDVSTDGRHAEVEFTSDWQVDASRRDLTINAVYADAKGTVYDYYNGIEDLEKGIVKFIGNPSERIKEDYLRILRFFRFYSIFGKGEIDKKALAACVKNKDGLKQLSIERVGTELEKILLTPQVVKTLQIMAENDILSAFLPDIKYLDKLEKLIDLTEGSKYGKDAVLRLFVLYYPDGELAENLAFRLKMTKKNRQRLYNWATSKLNLQAFADELNLKCMIYEYGKEFCQDMLLLLAVKADEKVPYLLAKLQQIDEMVVPVFPVRGKDVIEAGVQEKEKIGCVMQALEKMWEMSGFVLNKEELLGKIKEIACK